MTGKELYPLVYHIVTQAQKTEKQVFKRYPPAFNWSLNIPNPNSVTEELAAALCTSVVQGKDNLGLELFFPEKVHLEDLIKTKTKDKIEILLKWEEDGKIFGQLGAIIQEVFKDDLGLTKEKIVLLKNIG
jgi:hypothetical protein